MGAQLAKSAVQTAALLGLTHAEARLFFHMALTAKDTDSVPRYFASRDDMAVALGFGNASSNAAERAIERAIAGLKAKHAITPLNRPHIGTRAEYRLEPHESVGALDKESTHKSVVRAPTNVSPEPHESVGAKEPRGSKKEPGPILLRCLWHDTYEPNCTECRRAYAKGKEAQEADKPKPLLHTCKFVGGYCINPNCSNYDPRLKEVADAV